MPYTLRFDGSGLKPFRMMLDRFGDNVSDMRPALDKMADAYAGEQAERFAAGNWAPLSLKYAAWKNAHYPGAPILTRTGELRDSMSTRPFGVEDISNHRLIAGTQVEYAQYHQNGMGNNPVRKIVDDMPGELERRFADILHQHAFQGVST
ncbi:phage virion morphogenesis protein [Nesterenkonia flava]|uniref:Phage virion morphogenesis protein n=1 Tax=Nesterenkonia flava TaxID=469799 RepID=A0ABU1FRX2_9MICC|nr:phage virion morphogenesis protein [Nesterenkonia flava]MDR5711406.1 phage virion morphogenesis protein [Nesterenkonia flava]